MLNIVAKNKLFVIFDLNETNKNYVEINDNIYFFEDGNRYLITSEKDGFNDIYLGNIKTGETKQLIKQKFEVVDFYGVDEQKNRIFYSLAYDIKNRQPMMYDLNSNNTVSLSTKIGTHKISFNSDFSYYLSSFSNATTPPIYALCKTDSALNAGLVNNYSGKILKDKV